MPFTKLQFRPGVNKETTSYANEGGWFDTDKVRFRFGFPEKIGGWIKVTDKSFLGTCRALHPWIALDGSNYLGVGTHLKYYIEEGTVEFSNNNLLVLTSTAKDLESFKKISINDLIQKEEEKLKNNKTSDKERYVASYKIETLKQLI